MPTRAASKASSYEPRRQDESNGNVRPGHWTKIQFVANEMTARQVVPGFWPWKSFHTAPKSMGQACSARCVLLHLHLHSAHRSASTWNIYTTRHICKSETQLQVMLCMGGQWLSLQIRMSREQSCPEYPNWMMENSRMRATTVVG